MSTSNSITSHTIIVKAYWQEYGIPGAQLALRDTIHFDDDIHPALAFRHWIDSNREAVEDALQKNANIRQAVFIATDPLGHTLYGIKKIVLPAVQDELAL